MNTNDSKWLDRIFEDGVEPLGCPHCGRQLSQAQWVEFQESRGNFGDIGHLDIWTVCIDSECEQLFKVRVE